jgi:hypothetical protein
VATVEFTPAIQRHVDAPREFVEAVDVRTALEGYFERHPRVRDYVVDERGALRRHVVVFVNGDQLRDRAGLTDEIGPRDTVFVMQALSGG